MKRGATSANRIRTACLSPSMTSARRRASTSGATAWAHLVHWSLVRHFFQASVLRSAVVANCSALAGLFDGPAGQRDRLFDDGADFLGLFERGDDPPLDLGLVVVVLGVALGQKQGGGQAAQQGPLMAGAAAELASFSSMSHGVNFRETASSRFRGDAALRRYTAAEAGTRMPSRKPSSESFSWISCSVVSPKLRTSSS